MKDAQRKNWYPLVVHITVIVASLLHVDAAAASVPDAERLAVYQKLKIDAGRHLAAFVRQPVVKLKAARLDAVSCKAIPLAYPQAPERMSFARVTVAFSKVPLPRPVAPVVVELTDAALSHATFPVVVELLDAELPVSTTPVAVVLSETGLSHPAVPVMLELTDAGLPHAAVPVAVELLDAESSGSITPVAVVLSETLLPQSMGIVTNIILARADPGYGIDLAVEAMLLERAPAEEPADYIQAILRDIRKNAESWEEGQYDEHCLAMLAYQMRSEFLTKDSFDIYDWLVSLWPREGKETRLHLERAAAGVQAQRLFRCYSVVDLLREGQIDDAAGLADKLSAEADDTIAANARLFRAVAAVRSGDTQRARTLISEIGTKWPDTDASADASLLLAWIEMRSAGHGPARALAEKLVKRQPDTDAGKLAASWLSHGLPVGNEQENVATSTPALKFVSDFKGDMGTGNIALWEVVIENEGKAPVVLASVAFGGEPIASSLQEHDLAALEKWQWGMSSKDRFPSKGIYHHFYPSSVVAPGRSTFFSVSLTVDALGNDTLALVFRDSHGRKYDVETRPTPIPMFAEEEAERASQKPEITGISYAPDYSRIFVKYRWGIDRLQSVAINQKKADCVELRTSAVLGPKVLSARPAMSLRQGEYVHVTLTFASGARCDALVRVGGHAGAASIKELSRCECTASDLHAAAVSFRQAAAQTGRDTPRASLSMGISPYADEMTRRLCAPFCDAVDIRAVSMTEGHEKDWTIDGEINNFGISSKSFQPKPWFWLVDPQTVLDASDSATLKMLEWMAIVSGAKGVRYAGSGEESLKEHKDMITSVLPVGSDVLKSNPRIQRHTAWAGDRGVLVLLRDFSDGKSVKRSADESPVTVPLVTPRGYVVTGARDLVSGEKIDVISRGYDFYARVPGIDTYRTLWIDIVKN